MELLLAFTQPLAAAGVPPVAAYILSILMVSSTIFTGGGVLTGAFARPGADRRE